MTLSLSSLMPLGAMADTEEPYPLGKAWSLMTTRPTEDGDKGSDTTANEDVGNDTL